MKKSIVKILSLFLSVLFMLCGCTIGGNTVSKIVYPKGREAQAVLAFNPILYFDDETVTAFNDISASISADVKAKTVTTLSKNTNWKWISKDGEDWSLRSTYTLDAWRNRGNISTGKLKAYSYNGDGTCSLMCYSKDKYDLESYNGDSYPDKGVLMASAGSTQENLSYIVENDGNLEIAATTLTMMKSVGGVNTGFLDSSDGSVRTAIVNIMINGTVLWSGEFGMGVGENGEDVTFLETPALTDLPVTSGDVVSFGIQLNGEKYEVAEKTETEKEQEKPAEKPDVKKEEEQKPVVIKDLTFVDGYNSRFEVVYPENASFEVQKLANNIYTDIENMTEAESRLKSDDTENYPASSYEILVGETNRSASKQVYSDLRGYRKNCANDYIIKVVGNNVVIAGTSESALSQAVDFFLSTYLEDDKSKVPGDLYIVSRPKVRLLTLNGTDVSKYVIRTEKYPSILAKRAAKQLAIFFASQGGVTVPVENDQKTTENEILVGLTERSGISSAVFKSQSLDYQKGYAPEKYSVFFSGKKLFVEAGSDYAAGYAVEIIKDYLTDKSDLPSSFAKSGEYSTENEDEKYALTDGYSLAWSDEFYTSDINGKKITNQLDNWTDSVSSGSTVLYTNYKPTSQLVTELLADPSNSLYKLLSKAQSDASHGEYYSFSKISRAGFGKAYGVDDNVLWQKATFDEKLGFYVSHLTTEESMDFRYGIFEVRMIAGTKDAATSAVWFHGGSGAETTPEIDIYENFGGSKLAPNLHTWSSSGGHTDHGSKGDFKRIRATAPEGESFADAYHYVGIEWTADYIDFYLDGEIFCTAAMTDPKWDAFEQKIYPELAFGTTGGFYQFDTQYPGDKGGISELLNFNVDQKFDYVRIYQKNGQKQRVWKYKSK